MKKKRQSVVRGAGNAETLTSAPVLKRIAAVGYDSILLLGVLFGTTALLLILNQGEAFRPGNPYYGCSLIATSAFFFCWFWTHGGQTLGMRAWKIRLVRNDGKPCGAKQALAHFLIGTLACAFFGMGWWYALFDRNGRTLQDVICATRVIRAESKPEGKKIPS